jgi:acetyltransferase EpsM
MINIYGKGGHAKVVNSVIKFPKKVMYWDDDDYNDKIKGYWVIAIGSNEARKRIAEKLGNVEYLTIISDTAITSGNSEIKEGSQILHGSVIQIGTKIGKHCIVNTAASIDHDCILEDFTFVGPNATLCGGVEIGEGSFIGAGAVILPRIKIGKNCMIGAGSVVTKDIPEGWTVYGNPAKIN